MAISTSTSTLSARLVARRHGLLLALLAVLYLVLWQGPQTTLGRALFIVHLGFFMLWQPFVHGESRLSWASLLGLSAVVLASGAFLQGWILILWIMILASIVGGKVLLFGKRAPRLFYLLALAFLVVALLLMAAPMIVPQAKPAPAILVLGYTGMPLLLATMAMLPRETEAENRGEVVDFVYSLFIFLLLAVLMLGSLAAMLLFGSGYVEALLQTLLATGAMLLLLGLAANPRSGVSGIGSLISRYLLSIGLPIEKWLEALANLALREEDPQVFLEKACAEIAQQLPWVQGGAWVAGNRDGRFGVTEGRRLEFSHGDMVLLLYTRHPLSPTLIWHYNLLAQLLAQFHADKQRGLALKQLSYMQAIHETGARLTHDVKNLLQSLNALCSAGIEPGAESSLEYQSLLRRQLPAISERLSETLAKLNAPQSLSAARQVPAADWWRELRLRMAALDWISFKAAPVISGELPAEVFSGVADNLIHNAADKHLREPAIHLQVELRRNDAGFELIFCDDGSAIADPVASSLFLGPVSSESGYGIGLYHAARYAQAAGYRLELEENRAGRVCFRLAQELLDYFTVGSVAGSIAACVLAADQTIYRHIAFTLEVDGLRLVKIEVHRQPVVGRGVALDHSGYAFRRDATGDVYGIAPQVVDEFFLAQHAGNYRSGTDADANLEVRGIDREVAPQQIAHGHRHVGDRAGVVVDVFVQAAGNHVGIADGLDFFQPVLLRQFVEGGKYPVQHREYL